MNVKRYLLAVLAVFVFIFFYHWLVQGVLLVKAYGSTAHLWRNLTAIKESRLLIVCFEFLLSAWIAFVFTRFFPKKGNWNGLLFGLYFGVFAGILSASWYLWLPIGFKLAALWFLSNVLQGIGSGYILGFVYRK